MLIQQNMRSAAFAEIPNPYMPGTDQGKEHDKYGDAYSRKNIGKRDFCRPEAVSLISAG